MMPDRPIILTGFMSSGKTSIARSLGKLLLCQAVDLDDAVTAETGQTPKGIIEAEGEGAFRIVETRVLESVLGRGIARVIALGGGTWTLVENRQLVASHGGLTFWLDAAFDLCWSRIPAGGGGRPLASNKEKARALYDARQQLYALADVRILVGGERSVEEIALEIMNIVSSMKSFS